MIVWRDASSYSRGQRGAIEPTCWDAEIGEIRLSVHRLLHCEGWYASCSPLLFDRRALSASDVEDARTEALDLLRRWLDRHGEASR